MNWSSFGPAGLAFGAGLTLLLFACVTLHEFGHALVAQRFGIPVREIVLLPIGGVAVLSRNPNRPMHELLIAAAGPAVNVVIAAALLAVMALTSNVFGPAVASDPRALLSGGPSVQLALAWLLSANVGLVLFNLIPAFPMDGGRIFRGALGLFTDWTRATLIATRTGQVIAVALGLAALFTGQFMLAFVAAFVYFGAGSTLADERRRAILARGRAGDVCNRRAVALTEHGRLGDVLDLLLAGRQTDFAVLRGPHLVGVVTRERAMHALRQLSQAAAQAGPWASWQARQWAQDVPAVDVMARDVPRVAVHTPLDTAGALLQEAGSRVATVFDGPAFVGLLTHEDLSRAFALLSDAAAGRPAEASHAWGTPWGPHYVPCRVRPG